MFEIIGIAFCAIFLWSVFKKILGATTNAHMAKSCIHASEYGVPLDFANRVIRNREMIMQARNILAENDPDFALQDAYVQFGQAIAFVYRTTNVYR